MVASEFLSRLFQRAPRGQPQPQPPPPQVHSEPSQPARSLHHSVTERINPVPYVSRAVLESPGIADSTCQVNGDRHNPQRIPILPPDYNTLFAATSDTDNQIQKLNLQNQSPFFSRLPPEIRQLIYVHAFGGRRIHIDYDFIPVQNQWSWWHRVCDDEASCPEKEFVCPETAAAEATMLQLGSSSWVKDGFEYKIDAIGWLRSCKIGYHESLPVMYSSNTFVLSQGIDQLFRITRVMPRDHSVLLTSLCVEIDVYRICKLAPPKMDDRFRQFYRNLFSVIQVLLPNLHGLSLSIAGIPGPPRKVIEWSDEDELAWVGPWEELARGRRWKRLEIALPVVWFGAFEAVVQQRVQAGGKKRYTLIQGLESFRKGW